MEERAHQLNYLIKEMCHIAIFHPEKKKNWQKAISEIHGGE